MTTFKLGAVAAARDFDQRAHGADPQTRIDLARNLVAELCRVYRAPLVAIKITAGDHSFREHATHPHLDRLMINPSRTNELSVLLTAIGDALCKRHPWGLHLAIKAGIVRSQ